MIFFHRYQGPPSPLRIREGGLVVQMCAALDCVHVYRCIKTTPAYQFSRAKSGISFPSIGVLHAHTRRLLASRAFRPGVSLERGRMITLLFGNSNVPRSAFAVIDVVTVMRNPAQQMRRGVSSLHNNGQIE